jgi:hypothetical protein
MRKSAAMYCTIQTSAMRLPWAWSSSPGLRTLPTSGSAPVPRGGWNEGQGMGLDHIYPGLHLFLCAADCDNRVFHAHEARRIFLRGLPCGFWRWAVSGNVRLLDTDRGPHHRCRHPHRCADCLLDPPAPAEPAARRRIHNSPAADHPGHRHRLRLFADV